VLGNKKITIKSNIAVRSISGLVIATLFIFGIFFYRPFFYILLYLISAFMLSEWHDIAKHNTSKLLSNIVGYLLIPLSLSSLMFMSYIDHTGWLLLSFFAILWSVDIMAMCGGKLAKGAKLAPKLSPNKTISGLIIGVTSGAIMINLLTLLPMYQIYLVPFNIKSKIILTILACIVGITAQLSDLLISYFKRKAHIKDSGNIIPGHGGILDRFDSIILTSPLIVLCFKFC